MKKCVSIFSAFLALILLVSCQDEYLDQPKYTDGSFPDNAIIDDSGITEEYDWHALGKTVSMDGRDSNGGFSISTSMLMSEYNKASDHKINNISRSEKQTDTTTFLDYIKYDIDDDLAIYVETFNSTIQNAYFSFPVLDTSKDVWDYQKDIDALFAIFDPSKELTLDYLSKVIDVDKKVSQQAPQYYIILRKYMYMTFLIQDGIAYVGIGAGASFIPEDFNTYFSE